MARAHPVDTTINYGTYLRSFTHTRIYAYACMQVDINVAPRTPGGDGGFGGGRGFGGGGRGRGGCGVVFHDHQNTEYSSLGSLWDLCV